MTEKKKKPTPSPTGTPTSQMIRIKQIKVEGTPTSYMSDIEPMKTDEGIPTPTVASATSTPSPGGTPTSYFDVKVKPTQSTKPKTVKQPPLKPLKPLKKISILYIISTTRIGGGETALKRLLRNLDTKPRSS